MNIIAFEDQPTLFAGGQERSLFEVLKRVAQRGNNVKLFYREPGELLPEYHKQAIGATRVVSRRITVSGIPTILRELVQAKDEIRQFNADFLYVNQYADTPFPALLSKLTGVPLLVHLRLPCPHYLSRQYRWGLRQSRGAIAISAATKQGYVRQGIAADKIEVLHNSIDTGAFSSAYESLGEQRKTKIITYLGRICPDKGIEILIEAFRLAYKHDQSLVLQIAGKVHCAQIDNPEEYLNKLKDDASDIPAGSLRFLPHQSDVSQLIAGSTMLALPSLWEEPFGRTIVEGMACGVPTLASDIGGIPEILAPNFSDWLVPPGDVEAWAEAMLHKINWPQHRPELASRLKTEAEHRFNMDDYITNLIQTFRMFLTKPHN